MNNPLSTLSLAFLLTTGLITGCDAEPESPTDRGAILVLEVDGVVVEENDVSRAPGIQEDMLDRAESTSPQICEGDSVSLDLTLEIEGDQAAELHGCTDAAPASSIDELTAEPDVQAGPWCQICDTYPDNCFACCRCGGDSRTTCALIC